MPLREMPRDIEAEQALLCCCLKRPEIAPFVQESIGAGDFYLDDHQHIFEAICSLGKEADVVTVGARLIEQGHTGKRCSVEALDTYSELLSSSVGWRHYAKIIREMAQRRLVIKTCENSAENARNRHEPLPDILSTLKTDISQVEREQTPEIESSLSVVQQVYREIEARHEAGNQFVGIRTGLENIDSKLFGMEPGSTTYLIARPSIGKSSLALTIADYVAAHEGPVLFFSLESNGHALTRRRLAARSGLHLTWIRTGDIRSQEQWGALQDACDYLSDKPLMIVDHARYKNPQALCSLAETANIKQPLKLIIVDHIQLTRPVKPLTSRHQEISIASADLQGLSKTCNCPILILCQLSRPDRLSKQKYPTLEMMKESGDLEQNADNVWGLWRGDKESEFARLEQLKGRDSGTWVTWLNFDRFCQRFTDGVEPAQGDLMRPSFSHREDV